LSRDRAFGLRPEAFRPCKVRDSASQYNTNRSPPIPQLIGSVAPITALAAMAASAAFPPACKTRRAAWTARGWLVAAMPFRAITTLRD
jgi:hypothetical protein